MLLQLRAAECFFHYVLGPRALPVLGLALNWLIDGVIAFHGSVLVPHLKHVTITITIISALLIVFELAGLAVQAYSMIHSSMRTLTLRGSLY